ncbi:MAG: hypothetical protein JST00_16930 [Deltaproteobacteria bacterium]|nr:hypothetical protein [Deltaproteobacteria bacterium]
MGRVEASTTENAETFSFAWSTPERRFRDCDLVLTVVAPRSSAGEGVEAAIREADGVVVVVDAHPAAQAKNRTTLDAVRALISSSGRSDVPVVLQVDEADLPDAMSADDVVGGLGAVGLPSVAASATGDAGVVETLATAVDEVLAQLRPEHGETDAVSSADADDAAPGAESGHPLLTALRTVLKDTVRDHAVELGARVLAGLEAQMLRVADRQAATDRMLTSLGGRLAKIEDTVAKLHDSLVKLRPQVDAAAAATSKLDRLRDDMRSEVIRTTETRGRADREHLATAMQGLRGSLQATTEAVAPRMDAVERSLASRMSRVEVTLETWREELHVKLDGTNALVKELTEELKKPKKGWFT